MNWGKLQRECHRLIVEVFPSKRDGYKWLSKTYGINHFSEIPHGDDRLREIYEKLYVKSFEE